MKKTLKTSLILFFLSVVTISANATTTAWIIDNYWGALPVQKGYPQSPTDLIGAPSLFEISKMSITFTDDGNMVIDIYSRYFDNVGSALGTELGDVFISIDGWRPQGPAPYTNDNYYSSQREDWEYALVFDNHNTTSGSIGLFSINDQLDILTSDDYWGSTSYSYRSGQETRVKTENLGSPFVTGSWAIHNFGSTQNVDDYNDFLRITISDHFDWGTSRTLAFHYAPTCGNDVIEGVIPEPSTVLLLGSGLIGFGVITRIRRKRS